MKKISLILALILCLSIMSGCSLFPEEGPGFIPATFDPNDPNMEPEDGAEILVWCDSGPRMEYLRFAGAEFEKLYNVKVKLVETPNFGSQLAQDAPAGMGPDIIETPHDKIGQFAVAGLIAPNTTTAEQIKADCPESVVNAVSYDGETYGYPLSMSTYALIYNKNIFKTPPESFEELAEFSKTWNKPIENRYTIMWTLNGTYYVHSFIAGYGGYVFGNNGNDPTDIGLATDGAVKGMEYYRSLRNIVNLNSADSDTQIMDALFLDGKLGCIISGQWSVSSYQKQGADPAVCMLPKMANGERPKPFVTVQMLGVSAYAKCPKAARVFAKFASSSEMLEKRFEITGEITARNDAMESDAIKNDPIASVFLQQAKEGVAMPVITEMNCVWDAYTRAIQTVWDRDTDVKDTMEKCVTTIKEQIASIMN